MVPQLKKILYATDLSENARYAFGYAASLAHRYDAAITILHVVEKISPATRLQIASYMGEEQLQRMEQEKEKFLLDSITERLNGFCREMDAKMDTCKFIVEKIVVVQGIPHEVIIQQAEVAQCDLIVMGTHGHNAFKDALIGGTARRVVRRSPLPVMVIRLPESESD